MLLLGRERNFLHLSGDESEECDPDLGWGELITEVLSGRWDLVGVVFLGWMLWLAELLLTERGLCGGLSDGERGTSKIK